jgi:protein-tyrosine phosphatase
MAPNSPKTPSTQTPDPTAPGVAEAAAASPARVLPLQGASNFRDLGGYVGASGRALRWGRIFRSDHLGQLTAQDLTRIAPLGLATVCDFRGVHERAAHPCAIPGVRVQALSIEPTVVQAIEDFVRTHGGIGAPDAVRLMQDTYRAFVTDNSHRFAELFAHLLDGPGPLVFHCTAGKDRTGFAAALILHALGVQPAVVMHDYLLSNDHYKPPPLVGGAAPAEVREAVRRVQQSYLDAAYQAIAQDHSGVGRYLQTAIKLSPDVQQYFQSKFLE